MLDLYYNTLTRKIFINILLQSYDIAERRFIYWDEAKEESL